MNVVRHCTSSTSFPNRFLVEQLLQIRNKTHKELQEMLQLWCCGHLFCLKVKTRRNGLSSLPFFLNFFFPLPICFGLLLIPGLYTNLLVSSSWNVYFALPGNCCSFHRWLTALILYPLCPRRTFNITTSLKPLLRNEEKRKRTRVLVTVSHSP